MADELIEDQTEPQVDEAAQSELARQTAAVRTARGVLKRTPEPLREATVIESTPEYDALPPGSRFMHISDMQERRKPYSVTGPEDYAVVPEGEHFTDPEGNLRQKPKYEGTNFTATTLYNMAVNDKERRKALEKFYPGRVKEAPGTGELYVEDEDGTLRKPKGALEGGGPSFFAKEAAPVVGSTLGEIGGGILGIPGGPPGILAGAVGGGAAGGAVGEGFNGLILQLAGVYDRSGGEQAGALATSAAGGAIGTAVGRGVAYAAPMAKDWLLQDASKRVGKFLGVNPEGLATAVRMREAGLELAPPAMWAPESPYLINIAQVFDPAFRTQKPMMQAAEAYADQEFRKILKAAGIEVEGSLTKPTVSPSTAEAEAAIMSKRTAASNAADSKLNDELLKREIAIRTEGVIAERENIELARAAQEAKTAADAMVQLAFKKIQQDINAAMAAAKAKTNSGDLWRTAGANLQQVNRAVRDRADNWFDKVERTAGDRKPNVEGLAETADAFLRQLPDGFENMHPNFVKSLKALRGDIDETGNAITTDLAPPVEPTWSQLLKLQQELRSNYNYYDLAPSIKEGTFKYFSNAIDSVLHDIEAVPELREASRLLQLARQFYRENVVPLSHAQFQLVAAGVKAGFAADPKVLFDTLVKNGQSDLTRSLENIVGPATWAAIKSADRQLILDMSKSRSLVTGEIDAKEYVSQILSRARNGMLESVHGKDVSKQLIEVAQMVQALHGELPIATLQNDTIKDVITKAHLAAQAAEAAAKKDPLTMLEKEMEGIRKRHKADIGKARADDPLRDVYSPTVGANKAVERILGNENLLLAAAARFGENSDTFNTIFQVWLQRTFRGTLNPGKEKLFDVAPQVQELMARKTGMSVEQLTTLLKDFDFLMSSQKAKNVGTSIQAGSKISTPWSSMIWKGPSGVAIPGFDTVGRKILGDYYKLWTLGLNNMLFLKWLEKGLKGDPAARELTRQTVARMMNRGGMVGAAAGEAMVQGAEPEPVTAEEPAAHGGAFQASDGEWYVPDPRRPGKYLPAGAP